MAQERLSRELRCELQHVTAVVHLLPVSAAPIQAVLLAVQRGARALLIHEERHPRSPAQGHSAEGLSEYLSAPGLGEWRGPRVRAAASTGRSA